MKPSLLLINVVILSACSRPPPAPETLDDLCAYLFEHLDDEDDYSLAEGTENLRVWLGDHFVETELGYEVTNLTNEAASAVEVEPVELDRLLGVATAYDINHSIDTVMNASLAGPVAEIYDTYQSAEREFYPDVDCFLERECDWLEADQHSVSLYPLGLVATTSTHGQYRWIETSEGPAVVQRSWMLEGEFSLDWIKVEHQYYVSVTMPIRENETRKMEATWIMASLGDLPVSEALVLQLALSSISKGGQNMNDYLDSIENP